MALDDGLSAGSTWCLGMSMFRGSLMVSIAYSRVWDRWAVPGFQKYTYNVKQFPSNPDVAPHLQSSSSSSTSSSSSSWTRYTIESPPTWYFKNTQPFRNSGFHTYDVQQASAEKIAMLVFWVGCILRSLPKTYHDELERSQALHLLLLLGVLFLCLCGSCMPRHVFEMLIPWNRTLMSSVNSNQSRRFWTTEAQWQRTDTVFVDGAESVYAFLKVMFMWHVFI